MKLETINDVNLLMNSSVPAAALDAAVDTGLLWRLTKNPLNASEIARELKIPVKRCHYWLQLLNSIGILEINANGYAPSFLAREAILDVHSRESWQHLFLDERERSSGVHNLAMFISEPGSLWAKQGLPAPMSYVDRMRDSIDRAREFTRMLFEIHQILAIMVANRLDLTGVARMMDLGGNSGVVSMALLRKYPALTSTVIDIENVCIAGREIAQEQGFTDRITYYPAEFASDDFPSGFDLVLKCDVSVFENSVLQKLRRSLVPGGRLVCVDRFSPAENYAPLTRIEWTFLDSLHDPDFHIPTVNEFVA